MVKFQVKLMDLELNPQVQCNPGYPCFRVKKQMKNRKRLGIGVPKPVKGEVIVGCRNL